MPYYRATVFGETHTVSYSSKHIFSKHESDIIKNVSKTISFQLTMLSRTLHTLFSHYYEQKSKQQKSKQEVIDIISKMVSVENRNIPIRKLMVLFGTFHNTGPDSPDSLVKRIQKAEKTFPGLSDLFYSLFPHISPEVFFKRR